VSLFIFEDSNAETTARLRLEPSWLGRHDQISIRNIHQLINWTRM